MKRIFLFLSLMISANAFAYLPFLHQYLPLQEDEVIPMITTKEITIPKGHRSVVIHEGIEQGTPYRWMLYIRRTSSEDVTFKSGLQFNITSGRAYSPICYPNAGINYRRVEYNIEYYNDISENKHLLSRIEYISGKSERVNGKTKCTLRHDLTGDVLHRPYETGIGVISLPIR